jgi:hypothetical protein
VKGMLGNEIGDGRLRKAVHFDTPDKISIALHGLRAIVSSNSIVTMQPYTYSISTMLI